MFYGQVYSLTAVVVLPALLLKLAERMSQLAVWMLKLNLSIFKINLFIDFGFDIKNFDFIKECDNGENRI